MDQETRQIAQNVLDRLSFDSSKGNTCPIGRVKVILGNNNEERIFWILRKERGPTFTTETDITGRVIGVTSIREPDKEFSQGITISRDAPLGQVIINDLGSNIYITPSGPMNVTSLDKASFRPSNSMGVIDATDAKIEIRQSAALRFASLLEAMQTLTQLQKDEADLEVKINESKIEVEAEQLRHELAQKKLEIEEERRKQSWFINEEVKLRDQPILDRFQEDVKRSNLLNGGLIITGAPGTGKTTSLIQRISFLISNSITQTATWLKTQDEEILFNNRQNWIFFSPSELLKMYLKEAMTNEELPMSGDRVVTWNSFRKTLLRKYGWTGDSAPFYYSNEKGSLFEGGHASLANIRKLFIDFILDLQKEKFEVALNTPMKNQTLDRLREELRVYHMLNTMNGLIRFFVTLQVNFQPFTSQARTKYKEDIEAVVSRTQAKLKYSEDSYKEVLAYLEEINTRKSQEEIIESSDEDEEVDNVLEVTDQLYTRNQQLEFDHQLNAMLARIYRDLALQKPPSSFNKDIKGLYDLVVDFIEQEDIAKLRPFAVYLKVFAPLTNGIEFNILKRIPSIYKKFRKKVLINSVIDENKTFFQNSIKEGNKKLHPDEFDFLIWNNHLIYREIYHINKKLFTDSKDPQLVEFKESTRSVVAIDEASDFSAVQLHAMASFSHPRFNCVTLSGDLMQRMTTTGITTWDDFIKLWPNTEVKMLKKAYRQTPALLKIASNIYKNTLGQEPPFISYAQMDPRFPKPLFHQEESSEKMLEWVAFRILEINRGQKGRYPTIALFVEDDSKIRSVCDILKENEDLLNMGIEFDACYEGRFVGDKQAVRIFSVQYIKGMEFEAVFMLNIDQMSSELLNQYLYVGLTRANMYLALTAKYKMPQALNYLLDDFEIGSNW